MFLNGLVSQQPAGAAAQALQHASPGRLFCDSLARRAPWSLPRQCPGPPHQGHQAWARLPTPLGSWLTALPAGTQGCGPSCASSGQEEARPPRDGFLNSCKLAYCNLLSKHTLLKNYFLKVISWEESIQQDEGEHGRLSSPPSDDLGGRSALMRVCGSPLQAPHRARTPPNGTPCCPCPHTLGKLSLWTT